MRGDVEVWKGKMLKRKDFEKVGCEKIMKWGDVKGKNSKRAKCERITLREKDIEKGGH